MAAGIWLRRRIAHATVVVLLGIYVVVPVLLSLVPPFEGIPSWELGVAFGCAFVAWLCLVLSWRSFWRRAGRVSTEADRPRRRRELWRGIATRIAVGAGAVLLFGAIAIAVVSRILPHHPRSAEDAAAWYEERPEHFAEVVELARSGAIPGVESEYYGGELPSHLAYLSENGKVASVGSCDGSVLFLPQVIGIPDDAIGYVHLACSKWHNDPAHPLDLFGDVASPSVEIGDGWWWADGT